MSTRRDALVALPLLCAASLGERFGPHRRAYRQPHLRQRLGQQRCQRS